MAANDNNNWSDLLDIALFEAGRVSLGQHMEHAKEAILARMEELLQSEDASSVSERVALRNALSTLAKLRRIAYACKPGRGVRRERNQAVSP